MFGRCRDAHYLGRRRRGKGLRPAQLSWMIFASQRSALCAVKVDIAKIEVRLVHVPRLRLVPYFNSHGARHASVFNCRLLPAVRCLPYDSL